MSLSITLCQTNPVVGDISGNLRKIKSIWEKIDTQSHLLIFPELFLCGYPPEDLLLKLDFLRKCR
ncbi:MAG: nitrilase-related carbon-nitrogen hydrolase, partial [Aquificaceae bacterium]